MFIKFIMTLILLIIYVNADAGEKYLVYQETNSNCKDHMLYKKREGRVTVVDIAGEKTELTKLKFEPKGRYHFRLLSYPRCGDTFYVIQDIVELSIPWNIIESIDFTGATCKVAYNFTNVTKYAVGKYLDGEFEGQGDFGEFKIKPNKVKQIIFSGQAIKLPLPELNAQLVLNNGSVISVREADMETVDLFNERAQDNMYSNVYNSEIFVTTKSEITIKKGETNLSVPFEKISKVEIFPKKGAIDLTLKSGQNIKGDFQPHDERKKGTIDGMSGICDEGGFFISIEHIKEYRINKNITVGSSN